MGVKTVIRLPNQLPVKASFANPRLISCHEQDRRALRIEREGHSPFALRRAEAQLLHVGVPGSVQCVNAGPTQLRPELLEQARQGQYLCLDILVQRVELRLNSSPISTTQRTSLIWHSIHMMSNPYMGYRRVFKGVLRGIVNLFVLVQYRDAVR